MQVKPLQGYDNLHELLVFCVRPLYSNLQRFVWRSHAGDHPTNMAAGTIITVNAFCYESVNLSFKELENIKIKIFPNR